MYITTQACESSHSFIVSFSSCAIAATLRWCFSSCENAVCKKIIAEERIHKLEKDLTEQSAIINPIFEKLENPYEKLVMQMRYEDGFEWDEIRGKIFGNRRDYSQNIEKYNNKVFRIHGSALKHMKELQAEK